MTTSSQPSKANLSSSIWSVADSLRGPFKQGEYGRVILPFTVLRRLECVLERTREKVLETFEDRKDEGLEQYHQNGVHS